MSKRLQVLLSDAEMDAIQKFAKREKVPVGEWVRRTLRDARLQLPEREPQAKLRAVRQAAGNSFPTAEIGQMLKEIESGYNG